MNTDTFSIDPPPGPTGPSELVVIDAGVADPDTLIAALPPGTAVLLLDPGRDGLEQIAAALQGRTGLTALHIVSHGAPGQIVLGSTLLGATTLAAHADALAALGAALAEHGDLLLYGCDVAVGRRAWPSSGNWPPSPAPTWRPPTIPPASAATGCWNGRAAPWRRPRCGWKTMPMPWPSGSSSWGTAAAAAVAVILLMVQVALAAAVPTP
jgi:hypothetical protein